MKYSGCWICKGTCDGLGDLGTLGAGAVSRPFFVFRGLRPLWFKLGCSCFMVFCDIGLRSLAIDEFGWIEFGWPLEETLRHWTSNISASKNCCFRDKVTTSYLSKTWRRRVPLWCYCYCRLIDIWFFKRFPALFSSFFGDFLTSAAILPW